MVAIKNTTEVKLIMDPILANKYCLLSFLKYDEITKIKGMNEKLRIKAVIVKIVKDTAFEAPESAIIRPKSLKKLPQK